MRIPGTQFSDINPLDPFGEKYKATSKALYDLISHTASITKRDMEKNNDEEFLFRCAVEELGEYSAAKTIEKGQKKKKLREGSKTEAVDLTLCALSLFFLNGGTLDELASIGQEKLQKWEDRLK